MRCGTLSSHPCHPGAFETANWCSRGIAHNNPMKFTNSISRNGLAIRRSKKLEYSTALRRHIEARPVCGLMKASIVGSRMYGASTVS